MVLPRTSSTSSSSSSSSSSSYDGDDSGHGGADNTTATTHTQHQLQTLQSLIPSSTQEMDERSIIEETRDYLQRIHQETEQIENELSVRSIHNRQGSSSTQGGESSSRPKITQVEVEELMERRFVVKISWKRGVGVGSAHVQRVIECLDVKMTSIVVKESDSSDEMLSTAFVKVKKDARKTEEEIHDLIMDAALRFGLLA